jgi:lysine-specific permease
VAKDKIGFTNWSVEEAPFVGGFKGTFSVFIAAYFSYGGTEMVGITAGEAANPRESVPKAIKGTFWRILIFYTGAILVMGMLLPYNHPLLNPSSDEKSSPFTLGLQVAHIPYAADIINLVIVIALLSAANSDMYVSSRTLMALAQDGSAPAVFLKTTKSGVPYAAMIPTFLFGLVALVCSAFSNVSVVLDWLMSLCGFNGAIIWMFICLIHIRFRAALKTQSKIILIKAIHYQSFLTKPFSSPTVTTSPSWAVWLLLLEPL